ncbi:hypothetical protein C7M84_000749 [Penaeus vannamei]|uniref:C-type lectin domain-containing protein n=1 Tax=Penaeus vannamei TaxID=6689 RepID=A0A423TVL5_PENVA|nr:hypothetical protein C7M84_000749 [Penaeus vannamei]
MALYERVALLEHDLSQRRESEARLEAEVLQLKSRVPALEEEIGTIPKMRKDLADFEAKIEKLVHDYEAKLSTLASEVIRLKKSGARRKNLETLSDQSDDVLLRTEGPMCPEVGRGLSAEKVGGQCLYFSWESALNWTSAHSQCQVLRGDLAAPQDLLPLKNFLHRSFTRGPSIWLGASYDLADEQNDDNVTLSNAALQDLAANLTGFPDFSSNLLEEEDDDGVGIRLQQDEAGSIRVLMEARGIMPRSHPFLDKSDDSEEGGRAGFPGGLRAARLGGSPSVHGEQAGEGNSSSFSADTLRSVSGESGEDDEHRAGIARDERAALAVNFASQGHREDSGSSAKREGKARMKCMLLQQKPSLEYELVGRPCSERHRFACAIESIDENIDKFTPDDLPNS